MSGVWAAGNEKTPSPLLLKCVDDLYINDYYMMGVTGGQNKPNFLTKKVYLV